MNDAPPFAIVECERPFVRAGNPLRDREPEPTATCAPADEAFKQTLAQLGNDAGHRRH